MTKINSYLPPKTDIWQGRNTNLANEYFYQTVQCINIENCTQDLTTCEGKKAIALIGFCCDVGIARNQGRIGARQGPEYIRTQLAKLAWHFSNIQLYDFGDVVCNDDNLENAQENLANVVAFALKNNCLPIVLGGGHETAWGHYQGIRKVYQKQNMHVINFDAHFDLRELLADNKGSSGTPFLQMAHYSQQHHLAFNYLVLGIQSASNAPSLFQTAEQLKVNYVTADEIFQSTVIKQKNCLSEFMQNSEAIYLSFCLDVMSAAIAPGVSAPQINGLLTHHVWPLLEFIIKGKKLISFDIVELAPKFDPDTHTARLASRIIYEVIKGVNRQTQVR